MMLQAGAAAPEIHLLSLTGQAFALSEELKRSPVLLVFFKISCPTCQLTLPFLERLHAVESEEMPHVIGISQDNANVTQEFNRHFGISFPVLADPSQRNYPASNAYGITNVPSLFLIEPDSRIAWSLNGFHKDELDGLGKQRFGISPFKREERIPAMRPG